MKKITTDDGRVFNVKKPPFQEPMENRDPEKRDVDILKQISTEKEVISTTNDPYDIKFKKLEERQDAVEKSLRIFNNDLDTIRRKIADFMDRKERNEYNYEINLHGRLTAIEEEFKTLKVKYDAFDHRLNRVKR